MSEKKTKNQTLQLHQCPSNKLQSNEIEKGGKKGIGFFCDLYFLFTTSFICPMSHCFGNGQMLLKAFFQTLINITEYDSWNSPFIMLTNIAFAFLPCFSPSSFASKISFYFYHQEY